MERNKTTKITVAALLIYCLAATFIWQPIIGADFWKYEPVRQSFGWVIFCVCATVGYYKGSREWYYTIALHLFNYGVFISLVQSIVNTMAYIEYDSIIKANKALNQGLIYYNLYWCSGTFAVVNIIIFCLIMPNIPKWLQK